MNAAIYGFVQEQVSLPFSFDCLKKQDCSEPRNTGSPEQRTGTGDHGSAPNSLQRLLARHGIDETPESNDLSIRLHHEQSDRSMMTTLVQVTTKLQEGIEALNQKMCLIESKLDSSCGPTQSDKKKESTDLVSDMSFSSCHVYGSK